MVRMPKQPSNTLVQLLKRSSREDQSRHHGTQVLKWNLGGYIHYIDGLDHYGPAIPLVRAIGS
jgi:hypothetical protein